MKTNKSHKHNSSFKVPEDYFGNVEDNVMRKIGELEPAEIPVSENGFSVPEGYFDNLENSILEKTEKSGKLINLFRKEYIYYAAAVAAIFILMLGNFFQTAQEETYGWQDVEISAMENYIDDGYNMGYIDWNTSEYSDLFDDATIIDDEDFNSVDQDAVFDYLDENMEDPTYILE